MVQEHKYVENHLVHSIYRYEMFHIILNGANPGLL